jgi:hypothetical protein
MRRRPPGSPSTGSTIPSGSNKPCAAALGGYQVRILEHVLDELMRRQYGRGADRQHARDARTRRARRRPAAAARNRPGCRQAAVHQSGRQPLDGATRRRWVDPPARRQRRHLRRPRQPRAARGHVHRCRPERSVRALLRRRRASVQELHEPAGRAAVQRRRTRRKGSQPPAAEPPSRNVRGAVPGSDEEDARRVGRRHPWRARRGIDKQQLFPQLLRAAGEANKIETLQCDEPSQRRRRLREPRRGRKPRPGRQAGDGSAAAVCADANATRAAAEKAEAVAAATP